MSVRQRPCAPAYPTQRFTVVSISRAEDKTGTTRNLLRASGLNLHWAYRAEATMNGLIYLVGLVVVIMFILSFLGLR